MQFSIPQNTQAVMGIPIGRLNDLDRRVSYLEQHPSGGSSFQAPLSGGLTGTNTWTTAPNVLFIDGGPRQRVLTNGNVMWTISGTGPYTTVLVGAPLPTEDIFAL
jgi:hypothetical protein